MVERILYNGNIVTLNKSQPSVSALAIKFGRIFAIGSDDEILALAGNSTKRENLGGKTVIPGMTDAHIHWEHLARSLQSVDLFEVPSKQEALHRVSTRASQRPQDEWILGRGWLQDIWDDGSFPTAADLDRVAPNHPVYLSAKSGHAAWVNSRALQVCGISQDTPDPTGGQIVRDANGAPTGMFFETAMTLMSSHIPVPTPEQVADMMQNAQALALASGLTGIHDFDNPSCMEALQIVREHGNLGIRVVKNVNQAWVAQCT